MKQKQVVFFGCIGDHTSEVGIVEKNHSKDPYSTTSLMESKEVFFCGLNWMVFHQAVREKTRGLGSVSL